MNFFGTIQTPSGSSGFEFDSLNISTIQVKRSPSANMPSTASMHLATGPEEAGSVSILEFMQPSGTRQAFVESEVQYKELTFTKRRDKRTGHSRYFWYGHKEYRNFHKGYSKPERLYYSVGRFLKYKLLMAQGFIRPDDDI